jgi:hypothetical protein
MEWRLLEALGAEGLRGQARDSPKHGAREVLLLGGVHETRDEDGEAIAGVRDELCTHPAPHSATRHPTTSFISCRRLS